MRWIAGWGGVTIQAHNTLGIACEIFSAAGDTDEGEQYGWQAVAMARQLGDSAAVANHLSQLSYTYDRKKDYQRGIAVADQAIALVKAQEIIDRNLLALTMEYKAYNLIDMKRNREAVSLLHEAMAIQKEVGNLRSYCVDLRTLSEALMPIDSVQALDALAQYTTLYDSLYVGDTQERIGAADAELHNDELTEENVRHRRRAMTLLGGLGMLLLLLVISIGVHLVYRHRVRKEVNGLIARHVQAEEARNRHDVDAQDTNHPEQPEDAGHPASSDSSAKSDPFLQSVDAVIIRLMPLGQTDITNVSSELCISPSQLRRRIQTLANTTPANYILAVRLHQAQRLLLSNYPENTVTEIAIKCGFADNAHLTRTFKRQFGMAPTEWVKEAKR